MELVGRQREHAALGNAIATAAEADGGILLVAGEGGVGKTALVESALAEDGGLVLRGAADQRAVDPTRPSWQRSAATSVRSLTAWVVPGRCRSISR